MIPKRESFEEKIIPVSYWTLKDVVIWLENVGFVQYVETFQLHEIDGPSLLQLTKQSMTEELHVQDDEDLERFLSLIAKLKSNENNSSLVSKEGNPLDFYSTSQRYPYEYTSKRLPVPSNKIEEADSWESGSTSSGGLAETSFDDENLGEVLPNIRPEYFKSFLASLYLILSGFIDSLATVVLQSSIIVMEKYPPLPDLFLDNFPYIWWAKPLSESIVNFLFICSLILIFFHKYRFVLIRRVCLIMGSMYLLRTITISFTRLPVPSSEIFCLPKYYKNIWEMLSEAGKILSRGGLEIHGVQPCGDYMFSGHTIALTLFSFFLIEYTPQKCYFIHLMAWLLNISGMILILLAHAHYSIDVIVAFYITLRMFLCYHYLANNRPLNQQDAILTKICYPLFSYFEANVEGVVPNEYSNPLSIKNLKWVKERVMHCLRSSYAFILDGYHNIRYKIV